MILSLWIMGFLFIVYFAVSLPAVLIVYTPLLSEWKIKRMSKKQNTCCYCPKCNNELISSGSFVSDDHYVTFKCSNCSHISKWLFDTPVPFLLEGYVESNRKGYELCHLRQEKRFKS